MILMNFEIIDFQVIIFKTGKYISCYLSTTSTLTEIISTFEISQMHLLNYAFQPYLFESFTLRYVTLKHEIQ